MPTMRPIKLGMHSSLATCGQRKPICPLRKIQLVNGGRYVPFDFEREEIMTRDGLVDQAFWGLKSEFP